jgi:hypothetical protein
MRRRQGAIVPGIHGLEYVQRLPFPDLSNDNSIGAHPQRILDQMADGRERLNVNIPQERFRPRYDEIAGVYDL